MLNRHPHVTRRALIGAGSAATVAGFVQSTWRPLGPGFVDRGHPRPADARPKAPLTRLDPDLLERALVALHHHGAAIRHRDRVAIVDFAAPSSDARLHIFDVADGKRARFRVSHGSGSDPDHTGFLHTFSNTFDSNASSEGAFVTADYYEGRHGRSQRLLGLDRTNCNALSRSIVIHGAWYANDDVVATHGKLGRSQGCFAVGEKSLSEVFDRLGEGRMIYASRG
ncbi:murein L,D-transpeptidase catalytic domain family protein [Novosphingobium anseongense]